MSFFSEINDLKKFAAGYNYFLYPAFNALCGGRHSRGLTAAAAARISSVIDKMAPDNAVSLLYDLRSGSYELPEKNYIAEVRAKCACERDYANFLLAGAFHRNVLRREECVRLLAEFPYMLPYVIISLNDTVRQVREASFEAIGLIAEKCSVLTAAEALVQLEYLRRKGRYDKKACESAQTLICTKLLMADGELMKAIASLPYEKYRRCIYSALFNGIHVSQETVQAALTHEKSKVLRDHIALKMLKAYDIPENELISFTHNPSPLVRLTAARKLYERNGLWDGAKELLWDKSSAVREFMIFAFENDSSMDLAEYYRSLFPKPEAVRGFGSAAAYSSENEAALMPLTESENPKTAAAAIYALCGIGSDRYEDIYWHSLFSPFPAVIKAAYRALVSCGAEIMPEKVYTAITENSTSPVLESRLISLLCTQNSASWERLVYLLKLYNTENESKRIQIRRAAERMHKNVYISIAPHTAEKLRQTIAEENLPEELVWEIKQILKNYAE